MLTRRFLTVKEVADLVQVSEASVRHWIKLQQLRAIDLGREWRVIPRDLEAFLAMHATCGAASPPVGASGGGTATVAQDGLLQSLGAAGGHSPAAPARGAKRGKEKRDARA